MNAYFATTYTTGDTLQMLFLMAAMWVLPALATLSAVFSFIAWRKRKESAFLLLALGFGVSAFVAVAIAAITASLGAGTLMNSPWAYLRFTAWIGPGIVLLGCWRLAAKKA